MKALSIQQPWAWLICAGYKDIENRNWRIGRKSRHGPYSSYHQANFTIELPCRIYVHAGKTTDNNPGQLAEQYLGMASLMEEQPTLTTGAIIGEVDITGCVTESKSPWFTGKYGFTLTNPVLYGTPVPCRGQLGFFEPEAGQISGGG